MTTIFFLLSAIFALALMAWSIERFFATVSEDPDTDETHDEHEDLTR